MQLQVRVPGGLNNVTTRILMDNTIQVHVMRKGLESTGVIGKVIMTPLHSLK